jgi:hypothetical protein
MSATETTFSGWTWAEAREKCADPELLASRDAATQRWRAAGSPKRFILSSGVGPNAIPVKRNNSRHLYKEMQNAQKLADTALQRELIEGSLIASGRRESPLLDQMILPPSAWQFLVVVDPKASIAKETLTSSVKIFDIRIYPVVEAPDAVRVLAGRTLIEVLKYFVWDDPEVVALRKAAEIAGCIPPALGFAWQPYRGVRPVDFGKYESAVGFLSDEPQVKHSRTIESVLGRRFRRLISYLSNGELVAEGIPRSGGTPAPVPRAYWQRDRTYVDVENGDLLEMRPLASSSSNSLSDPVLCGLELRLPGPRHDAERPSPKKAEIRIETTDKAKRECLAWLQKEMEKSPDVRPKPKDAWWIEAQQKWPKSLSRRAFDSIWTQSIASSGAHSWSYAGAPRKSSRR